MFLLLQNFKTKSCVFFVVTLPKTSSLPLEIGQNPIGKAVFQASIFRAGDGFFVSGRVNSSQVAFCARLGG